MSVPRLTRLGMTGNRFSPAFSRSLSKASGPPVCCDASPASRCCCPPACVYLKNMTHFHPHIHRNLHYHHFIFMSSEFLFYNCAVVLFILFSVLFIFHFLQVCLVSEIIDISFRFQIICFRFHVWKGSHWPRSHELACYKSDSFERISSFG